MAYLICICH